MIEINLLPEDLRVRQKNKETKQIDISRIPLKQIVIIAIAIFVVLQILAATTLFLKRNSFKKLDQRLKALEPQYKIAQSLKFDARRLNSRLSAVNELTSKSILWSKKLSDLSSAITDGIWLHELSLKDEEGQKARQAMPADKQAQPSGRQAMLLKGSAVSYPGGEETALIGSFINSLKSNQDFFEDFEDIKLKSSQMRRIVELEVMDFTIICYFRSGRRYFDKTKR